MSTKRQKILQQAADLPGPEVISLTKSEKSFFGLAEATEQPYVVLKYYDPEFECFSSWNPTELKAFSHLMKKLKSVRWSEIYQSGGKLGDKTGLGYTKHKDLSKLPYHPHLQFNPDLTFFELRVTQQARVPGFRVKSAFFLVWLDREHRIYPMK